MPSISMRALLEAGVHFGHQTRRWNPKMKPYIFAERNGIHIIDLAQTVSQLEEALAFVTELVANGDYVLFVGTKKQAQEPVSEEATRSEMPWVNHRWLGGMLTNFVTIRKRIGLLDQLEARQTSGDLDRLSKKEASRIMDEMGRLQLKIGGIRKMRRLPGAVFVVDPQREKIAVTEARRLEIPVIATGDTNVDPDQIDYIIPANDDAIRAIRLLCKLVADAAIEGLGQRAVRASEDSPLGAEITDAEEASDEVMAAIAAGGTYSFVPEPDEEDSVLPGEEATKAADGAAAAVEVAGEAAVVAEEAAEVAVVAEAVAEEAAEVAAVAEVEAEVAVAEVEVADGAAAAEAKPDAAKAETPKKAANPKTAKPKAKPKAAKKADEPKAEKAEKVEKPAKPKATKAKASKTEKPEAAEDTAKTDKKAADEAAS